MSHVLGGDVPGPLCSPRLTNDPMYASPFSTLAWQLKGVNYVYPKFGQSYLRSNSSTAIFAADSHNLITFNLEPVNITGFSIENRPFMCTKNEAYLLHSYKERGDADSLGPEL